MWRCVCVCVCVCMCKCACVCVFWCAWVYWSVCLRMCACVSMSVHVYLWVHGSVSVLVRVRVRVCVHARTCMCVYASQIKSRRHKQLLSGVSLPEDLEYFAHIWEYNSNIKGSWFYRSRTHKTLKRVPWVLPLPSECAWSHFSTPIHVVMVWCVSLVQE